MNIPINLITADLSGVRPEKVEEIKSSIQAIGILLHPITLRRGSVEGHFELVTGRCRLKAIMDLNWPEIPAVIESNDHEMVTPLEVAIHENLMRFNLPWHEQVDLELQLHELRQSQHGKRKIGRSAAKHGGWSQEDTAKELGIALGAMSQDIFLANAIKRNPNLMKVQDKMTALKLAKVAAKRESLEMESLIPVSFDMNQVFCGNSLDILKEIPDDTFSLCLTDPPWSQYSDEKFVADASTLPVFREVYRVLRRDTMLYAILGTPDFYMYQRELKKMGFSVQEYPLIWVKNGTISQGTRPWEYWRDYELILVAAKGAPVLSTNTSRSSIFNVNPIRGRALVHPNEKPVALLKELIHLSTFDGASVLDPFAGSGSTLVAAKMLHRNYIGIERDFHFYEKIQRRLENCKDTLADTEVPQQDSL